MDASEPGLCFVPKDPAEPCGLQWLEPCGGLKAVTVDAPVYIDGEICGRVVSTASPSPCTVRVLGFDGERWLDITDGKPV